MQPDTARAATAVARARLGQAQRALRKAAIAVAQADDGFDSYGHTHATRERGTDNAVALIQAALDEHGHADIVVLTQADPSPTGAQTQEPS